MKTKQYAAHPLTTTQSELPSAILSALTIALLSALLFTSCSKHHYLELFLDPDGEPIENPGRILLSAPGVANPLLPAILTDPARKDRIVATVLHDQPVDVEAGTYNLLCAPPMAATPNISAPTPSPSTAPPSASPSSPQTAGFPKPPMC